MAERTEYKQGTFSWVDLATKDPLVTKAFYEKLFSWTFEEVPAGDSVYYMGRYKGKTVAALYQLDKQKQSEGIPSHWASYVTVDSCDETAKNWTEAGGEIFGEPFDVMGAGRMAVLRDPTGAVVNIWQPMESFGAEIVNEANCFCWNELSTRDLPKAKEFYTKIFGWEYEVEETEGYTMIKNKDHMNGGMMDMQGNVPDEVPPHWLVYFTVEDLDATRTLTLEAGGNLLTDVIPVGAGKFMVMTDPAGAAFAAIQMPQLDS